MYIIHLINNFPFWRDQVPIGPSTFRKRALNRRWNIVVQLHGDISKICTLSLISANSSRMKFYIPFLLVSLPPLLSSLRDIIFPLTSHRGRRRRRRAELDDRFINGVPTSTERYESMYSISLAGFELRRRRRRRRRRGWRRRCEERRQHVESLGPRFAPQRNGIYDARNLSATHKRANPFPANIYGFFINIEK